MQVTDKYGRVHDVNITSEQKLDAGLRGRNIVNVVLTRDDLCYMTRLGTEHPVLLTRLVGMIANRSLHHWQEG